MPGRERVEVEEDETGKIEWCGDFEESPVMALFAEAEPAGDEDGQLGVAPGGLEQGVEGDGEQRDTARI